MDSLDTLLDFSQCDDVFQSSPSLSAPSSSKAQLASYPLTSVTTPILPAPSAMSASSSISGPSHQYELYKQQTPFVPGAIASTMAMTQSLDGLGVGFMGSDDFLGFSPDLGFEDALAGEGSLFDDTITPNLAQAPFAPVASPAPTSNVGRLWPGAHSQAALAKAKQQQELQLQLQQQQQDHLLQQQQQQQQPKPVQNTNRAKGKRAQPTDPIVEQKITQLLNSMRSNSAPDDGSDQKSAMDPLPRLKKEEDDMDEDERLLASEEGKKLSSKERRQLRNKVSARAFRSRRKEYISQLEAEISNKVQENGELRAQNRAIMEENKRLGDLTRMLLSSPSFSDFLNTMTLDATIAAQKTSIPSASAPAPLAAPAPIPMKLDIREASSYVAGEQINHMAIDLSTSTTPADFSSLTIDPSAFNYQPQVYAVLELPEGPADFDASVLSGKSSSFVESLLPEASEKVETPTIEHPMAERAAPVPYEPADEAFESDPSFVLFHADSPNGSEQRLSQDSVSITHSEEEVDPNKAMDAAMERIAQISEDTAPIADRIGLYL